MTALGEKVKKLRVLKGLTQQGLADKMEASFSLVTALETGRRKYVSAEDIDRLARGLDVPPEELWGLVPGGRREARYIPITDGVEGGTSKTA